MIYYFYKITNNINGKFYYGVHSTTNVDDGYMGSGKYLGNAYNKYGKSNFTKEILKYFDNKDDMYQYEREIVNEDLVRDINCYNIKIGGEGGGAKWSESQRSKFLSKVIGQKRTPEQCDNISKSLIGREIRTEWREKISNTLKGNTPWNKNKHNIYTEEAISKISKSSKDRKWINNGVKSKFVKEDSLEDYLNDGYVLGRITKKSFIKNA